MPSRGILKLKNGHQSHHRIEGISMSYTVADQLLDILAATNVKRIYGIVGDSLNGLTDALRRHDDIAWIHTRHEETAAFAAGAEAHLTASWRSAPAVAVRVICI
jgi:thiamine pyrophosphate-dependent acetolactate synthase large subunit-like protein